MEDILELGDMARVVGTARVVLEVVHKRAARAGGAGGQTAESLGRILAGTREHAIPGGSLRSVPVRRRVALRVGGVGHVQRVELLDLPRGVAVDAAPVLVQRIFADEVRHIGEDGPFVGVGAQHDGHIGNHAVGQRDPWVGGNLHAVRGGAERIGVHGGVIGRQLRGHREDFLSGLAQQTLQVGTAYASQEVLVGPLGVGQVLRGPLVEGAGLSDQAVEQAPGALHGEVVGHRACPGALAEDGHAAGVATKGLDVALHPVKCETLILDTYRSGLVWLREENATYHLQF